MSLRIVYVITDLKVGGVPLHVYRLASAMRDRGGSPAVVSLAPEAEVSRRLADAGVKVWHCDAVGAWDARVILRLAAYLRALKPDITHSLLFHANEACRIATVMAGLPLHRLVCEIQTVEIERRWHLTVGGMTHRLGHCVIGNSTSVVGHLERAGRMSRRRLRMVAGGVDVAALDGASPASLAGLRLPDGVPVIGWVGRLDPVKGLEVLLAAFERMAGSREARLLLVGDGPMAPTVRRILTERRLWGQVSMLGARSDVASLLKACGMFVLPSFTEGFPNALLEAMAVGLPVVTSDVPGCHDLVTHEVNGLLAPAGDAEGLASAMSRLLDDAELAGRLGRVARETVLTAYTMERCVDRYLGVYGEIVGDRGLRLLKRG
jgi:glycosyltransferase involved in cell wall biosynthesis